MGRRSNKLTTDVTYKFENKENEIDFATSLELFIQNAKLRNLREHTIKYYLNELKVYNRYLVEQGIGAVPSKVTEEIIEKNIIVYMQDQGLKTVTINSRLRAIRAYFNFLHKHGHIEKNPVENVKLLKDRKHIIETFTKEQINKLLKAPDIETFTGLRDYTLMLLLLDTGVRVNELIGIDVQDVKLKEGVVVIRNTKNNFERVVPIQKKMKEVLEKYIAVRGVVDDPALFLTIEDTGLSTSN
ncbi:tyrosine-type recombinase/integrase [Bacillus sp. EB600]|uniref:tyrosine-type recombinase/integrase n=1 Tax=Bacillus sp. EB600 TaxID=2806345 RepID=UPI00210A1DEC|nr:tyrosine-type recombinase/integrase [Bacillus sp. EB600]MCQ6282534.1 tyrosine-type recombinase/integrase [Bacillus sp. EB600]